MSGDQGDKRNFFLLDDFQYFFRFEWSRRMDVYGSTDINKGKGKKGGINVADRHDIQTKVMLIEAEIRCIDEIKCDVRFKLEH